MATYQPTKPLSTDKLSDSQADIANNFTAIKDLVDVNHETFNSGASPEGKHIFVTLPERDGTLAKPYPVNLANEGALYTKEGATSAVTELFFRRENGDDLNFTEAVSTDEGWAYLPSGLLCKWGTQVVNGDTTITKNTAPYFAQILNVQITPNINNVATNNATVVLRKWEINAGVDYTLYVTGVQRLANTATACRLYWMIIGIPS